MKFSDTKFKLLLAIGIGINGVLWSLVIATSAFKDAAIAKTRTIEGSDELIPGSKSEHSIKEG